MKEVVVKNGYMKLLKSDVSNDVIKEIKKFLTRKNVDIYSFNRETVTYEFFIEKEDCLILPRFFPINKFTREKFKITNKESEGKKINIEHNISLRNEIQKRVVEFYLSHDKGVIKCKPGFGKTVVTIYMIATRKLKTIVVMHKNDLLEQWKERILTFTNLDRNEILILNGNTSNKFDKILSEGSIVLASVQTLLSLIRRKTKDLIESFRRANFGILIGDEVHISVGAPLFSFASLFIPCKYAYGLSATPYRNDRNHDIINYHLGHVKEFRSISLRSKVYFILFDYGVVSNRYKYIYWGGTFQRSRYLNMLKKSNMLKSIAYGLLNKVKEEKRETLFVAERIKLLQEFYNNFDFDDKGFFVSGSPKSELYKKVIFSTPGKIRDGVDLPEKDTLIITSPISNIEQLCGRIGRIAEDKNDPVIFDLVDISCNEIRSSWIWRYNFYKKEGWQIEFIYCQDINNKRKVTFEEASSIISKGSMFYTSL